MEGRKGARKGTVEEKGKETWRMLQRKQILDESWLGYLRRC